MKKGDIVYIYKTLPIGEIKYKGKITDTKIPYKLQNQTDKTPKNIGTSTGFVIQI
jgi:hypothetical protein